MGTVQPCNDRQSLPLLTVIYISHCCQFINRLIVKVSVGLAILPAMTDDTWSAGLAVAYP